MMDHREVQLSQPSSNVSDNNDEVDALASYQQQKPSDYDKVGPAIAKIMERQRLDHEGEEMKRRTRILYVLLGFILLCVYFTLLKRHFFQKHHITVPSPLLSEKEDITSGTLRV